MSVVEVGDVGSKGRVENNFLLSLFSFFQFNQKYIGSDFSIFELNNVIPSFLPAKGIFEY
jgi:hypothetical protein